MGDPGAGSTVPRWSWEHDPKQVRALLDGGGVLALPSESSYGLAVDPRRRAGVEAVYQLKRRDAGKPLLVVAASRAQLEALGVAVPEIAWRQLEAAWPAPLTAVLPLDPHIADDPEALPARAGSSTLAVRIPAHDQLRAWLARIGPVTATSANLSGAPPVLTVDGAAELLAGVASAGVGGDVERAVVEDKPRKLPGGPPSTLIAWAGAPATTASDPAAWRLLRAGAYDLTNSDFHQFMVPSLR